MNNDFKIKHLEFIQNVINRLANNSFLIKGWTITVSLTGFGFFVTKKEPKFLFLIVFSVLVFWILDSYYLHREKKFRNLYEFLIANSSGNNKRLGNLSMDTTKINKTSPSLLCVIFSFPNALVYIAITLMAAFLYLI